MNHKKIGIIFLVLLLLALIPFPFTKDRRFIFWMASSHTGILMGFNGSKSGVCIMGKP